MIIWKQTVIVTCSDRVFWITINSAKFSGTATTLLGKEGVVFRFFFGGKSIEKISFV